MCQILCVKYTVPHRGTVEVKGTGDEAGTGASPKQSLKWRLQLTRKSDIAQIRVILRILTVLILVLYL